MISSSPIIRSSAQTSRTAPASKRYKMSTGIISEEYVNIGFIGGGNLARSITQGILQFDEQKKKTIWASFATNGDKYKKMKALGVNVTTNNKDIVLNSDVIVLSIKPHQVLGILDELQKIYKELSNDTLLTGTGPMPKNLRPLVVSVATAITIKQIEEKTEISWKMGGTDMIGHLPVIRCLPTVATAVQSGVTVYSSGSFCNEEDTKAFLNIFNLCGFCQEVPEQYIDGFTSFTGSGIGFMAVIMEAMADGGVLVGIPRDLSDKMAAYTMMSTAKMVLEGHVHPHEIKSSVASPGGCTISGLKVIEESGTRGAIMGAIEKATQRAVELRNQQKT